MKIIGIFLITVGIAYFARQYIYFTNKTLLEPKVEYQFRPETFDTFFEEDSLITYYEPMFDTYHQRLLYSYPSGSIVKKG